MPAAQKLSIDTTASAHDMADAMFGNGIEILSACYSGAGRASGIFSGGDTDAPELTPSDSGVILSTGRATDVTNDDGDANARANTSTSNRTAGDEDLDELSGVRTYDAAVLEAEFVPAGDVLTMQVVFSSEEYLEYVGSGFNDAVGIWVNGVPAELTVGDGDITINNINDESNENLYVDNPANAEVANTEMDGFTVTLTLKAPVIAGEPNSIRIAIADGGDRYYDSNLLIAGDSVQTALIAGDDAVTVHGSQQATVDVLSNDSTVSGSSLTITHINGQPVAAGNTVTLSTGEAVRLNPDGTFMITGEGEDGANSFTYRVVDEDGNSDTAFVELTTVACFVAGSFVKTVEGPVLIETLSPGDMVLTRDHGPQPLRWIGRTRRLAKGRDAPVVLTAGALGNHGEIALSPNHRMLITGARAELLFGQPEVLVKAAHLIDDRTIRRRPGGTVDYVHLLFDRHEIVTVNGLESESYHPGPAAVDAFDERTQAELLDLMPQLRTIAPAVPGPIARPALKAHEAGLLRPASVVDRGSAPDPGVFLTR